MASAERDSRGREVSARERERGERKGEQEGVEKEDARAV